VEFLSHFPANVAARRQVAWLYSELLLSFCSGQEKNNVSQSYHYQGILKGQSHEIFRVFCDCKIGQEIPTAGFYKF
jgi:hypothetical protein